MNKQLSCKMDVTSLLKLAFHFNLRSLPSILKKTQQGRSVGKWSLYILFIIILHVGVARGQEVSVPVDLQYPLFLKILSFERELPERAGDEIVIGVVYQDKFRTSRAIKDDFFRNFERADPPSTVHGLPVRCIAINTNAIENLTAFLEEQEVDILYVTPVRALAISEIASLSQNQGIITLSATPEYVREGLSVGIDQKENRPQIIINKTSATLEGASFSGRLLQLAEVIDE